MSNLLKEADNRHVNKELVKTIWEEIHKESLKIEK
jgi:chorismate mutase